MKATITARKSASLPEAMLTPSAAPIASIADQVAPLIFGASHCEIVIAPPFTALQAVVEHVDRLVRVVHADVDGVGLGVGVIDFMKSRGMMPMMEYFSPLTRISRFTAPGEPMTIEWGGTIVPGASYFGVCS